MADLRERLETAIASIDSALQDARIVFCGNPGACSARNTNALADLDTLREVLAHPEKLSSPSATAATSEFVSVPREPTPEMWDAAWKSIGLPYRAKLSLHEIKTLFDKFHAAMLSAAPAPAAQDTPGNVCPRRTICTEQDCKYPACRYSAPTPAEPVDVLVLQESIKALYEVNTAWFNELEEIKKIVGYVPAECKQTLTRYIKGIVEKATSPVVEAERTSEIVGWMVEGICDGEEIVRDLFDELDKDQAIAFQKNNGGLIVPLVALRDAAPQLHPDMKPSKED